MKTTALFSIACVAMLCSSQAATLTWVGDVDTSWTTDAAGDTNWDTNTLPAASDTVNISNGDTVTSPTGAIVGNLIINLTGNSTLHRPDSVIRLNGATVNVAAGSALTGNGFWDLGNADFVFDDGAIVTASQWELKGTNTFTFNLGATGFTTLTPGTFRNDGNNPASPATLISDDTFTVDMASYTGGVGIVTLMDFQFDGEGMDNTAFQNANLVINNAGSYVANLQWNDTAESIELNITAVPEPSSTALLGLGGLALIRRRRK